MKMKRERNFWINSPARNARLLDWLESHPLESHIVYTRTQTMGHGVATDQRYDDDGCLVSTKTECYDRAAKGIFAADEDIRVRKALQDDENRIILSNRIRRQVERSVSSLSKVYFMLVAISSAHHSLPALLVQLEEDLRRNQL